jgi:hypothetical protein
VNPNFLAGYPGIRGEIYSVYGQLSVSAFGFGVFTNFSHALQFCDIIRVNPYTNGTERPIYCVGNKGGRMFRDNWSVAKEGVSFYGALLPNESNICPECFHRCDVFGDGWFVLAENWTTANVSYTRDNRSMDENVNMISTLPSTMPVWYAVRFAEASESFPVGTSTSPTTPSARATWPPIPLSTFSSLRWTSMRTPTLHSTESEAAGSRPSSTSSPMLW